MDTYTGVSGAATATFVYDGDGNRVKGTVNGTTTTYLGNYFEWTGSTTTMNKYYYAGATRVAMRQGSSSVSWLFSDHLGSMAITATYDGTITGELRYTAWGETRYTWGTTPTSFQYTGQRNEQSLGIYYYGARWYDPLLGRFLQADTIVPGGVQGLDRYAYVNNNSLKYTDPSGHDVCDEDSNCYGRSGSYTAQKSGSPNYYYGFGFTDEDRKILAVLIALESSSGNVPANIDYMKAWVFLNLRSYHQASNDYYTPYEDWKMHESGLLVDLHITGTIDEQREKLLNIYNEMSNGNYGDITSEEFSEIEEVVENAVWNWYSYGSGSSYDPVKGATGFWDASGMYYPNGNPNTDTHLQDIEGFQYNIMTGFDTMEKFRDVFVNSYLVVSRVYQFSWNPYTIPLGPVYTFTVFHGTYY